MQLGQLATVHESWFKNSVFVEGENRARGELIRTNIRVDGSEANAHFIIDAQLRPLQADVVPPEGLALSDHDQGTERMALFLPPSDGFGSRVVAAAPGDQALPVPVGNLVFQPPAATPRSHTVALADEGAQPRQVDDQHYFPTPVDRPPLEAKRLLAAEVAAKEKKKLLLQMAMLKSVSEFREIQRARSDALQRVPEEVFEEEGLAPLADPASNACSSTQWRDPF